MDSAQSKLRRFVAVVQDWRGYPAPGEPLELAPPKGPEQPMLYTVVKADEHDAEVGRLRDAIRAIGSAWRGGDDAEIATAIGAATDAAGLTEQEGS
jgi:hypothetical protein